jgi:serine/threonine protein kinase
MNYPWFCALREKVEVHSDLFHTQSALHSRYIMQAPCTIQIAVFFSRVTSANADMFMMVQDWNKKDRESNSAKYFRQILSAVSYMHSQEWCHR